MGDLNDWKSRQMAVLIKGGLPDETRGQIQGTIGFIDVILGLHVK